LAPAAAAADRTQPLDGLVQPSLVDVAYVHARAFFEAPPGRREADAGAGRGL
jgi:hypothetical protein